MLTVTMSNNSYTYLDQPCDVLTGRTNGTTPYNKLNDFWDLYNGVPFNLSVNVIGFIVSNRCRIPVFALCSIQSLFVVVLLCYGHVGVGVGVHRQLGFVQ